VYDWLLSKHIFPNQALGLERLYADADQLAAGVEPGAEGLMFFPYFSGEQSPGWNPDARGAIYGLSFHHEPKHYIRAALEGIAFSLRRVVSAIEEIRGETANKIYLTGGLTASSVCLQIIITYSGFGCSPPSSSSARGAAIVGWLALGRGQDYSTFFPNAAQQEASLTPDADLHRLYQQKYATFCALNDLLHDAL
jgi:gluconokinase